MQSRSSVPLPTTPTAWAAPLWAVTAGVLLLFTVALHFYAPGSAGQGPQLALHQGTAGTLSLLTQLLVTFAASALALLLIVAAVYLLRPRASTATRAATAAEFLQQAYQPRTAAPLRGYRPAEAPRQPSAWATPAAKINKSINQAGPLPAQAPFRHSSPPPAPPKSMIPTPLALQAENLLRQAHTIPNFATTPLPGQRRVLAKLADNFVPAPQRGAALALALFRLRTPARAA